MKRLWIVVVYIDVNMNFVTKTLIFLFILTLWPKTNIAIHLMPLMHSFDVGTDPGLHLVMKINLYGCYVIQRSLETFTQEYHLQITIVLDGLTTVQP